MPPAALLPPTVLDTFVELLANDTTWRSKVLKLIQYLARMLIVAHREEQPSFALRLILGAALPLPRLKLLAQSISLSRRMLYVGETLVYARNAYDEVGGKMPSLALVARPSALAALSYIFAGIGEDLSIASKIGLIDPASLPRSFPRYYEVTWALQCVWYAYFAWLKLVATQRACVAAQRAIDAARASESPSARAHTTGLARALEAARRDRLLAVLNACKCAADCTQSLPYALGWASFPEVLEVQVRAAERGVVLRLTSYLFSPPSVLPQAGLWSGIFNAARAWYAARVPPPPAPSEELEEEREDKEPLALAGAASAGSSAAAAAAPAAAQPPPSDTAPPK